ncbi:BTAD domain-containing putative transcriptional regulator [Deinococcus yavapaiensis]|uniref:AAA ATPase-like protein n=1 Tax=Deinococcus yavapaiensis KR-236 TaxID=694435 RepID=A0A318S8S6_9DEIO|nr:BTAD domain-containing putative transcriptional regulator [Deinococcus yavapaiensis]PYE55436.1 AAA ATPase-like protein [Deinococcus yavapaiensis KR-236]
MLDSRFAWRLALLGTPSLSSLTMPESRVSLERKTATLLAYLAMEGPTSRARLVELLWPETPAGAARNNLVHLLRRLRDAVGAELVEGGEVLSLHESVSVDARSELDPAEAPRAFAGGLLETVDLDDLPELSEWILAKREQIAVARARQYEAALARARASGDAAEAVSLAERWVDLDPLHEVAYRALMQAYYDLGDRPAALRAYHRCKAVLARELGTDPSPETHALARDIDRGTLGRVTSGRAGHGRGRLPLTVLRPPTLVGREDVWAKMEEAWANGLGIMLQGDPGSGKSRLAQDFLRSREGHQILLFQGRPGDVDVPYATHARNYRQTLEANPDLELPEWVVRELARMIPELGEAPPPMATEADKRRFYEAQYEVVRLVAERGPLIICTDDVQFMDEPSIEAGAYVGSRFWGDTNTLLRCLYCHRTNALPPYSAALLDSMYAAGVMVPIELPPLSDAAVSTLIGELDVASAVSAASEIARVTRGNVQFVLETVKNMVERGDGDVRPIAGPDEGVSAMIQERLTRLSQGALQAARAAAVLRREFSLELVAQTLGIGLLDTANAWEELEDAQVVSGEAFSHDLVLETVLSSMPASVRRVLHRSAARVLASAGAPPARVAAQYQEGEDARQAAPWLVKAAESALANLRFAEAHEAYTAAARTYAALGDAVGEASVRRALEALAKRVEQTAS